ncbi:MAG: S46 family peptidase [Verrucomicrobiota bacterium]
MKLSDHVKPYTVMLSMGIVLAGQPTGADEGMWLYNHPPRQLLRERHGFEPSEAWLENLQRASVRFSSGGSGEFVSPDGLVLSNHHVGSDSLQRLSSKEHDYLHDGFYARTRAEEKPCPGLELNVLESIEDVTARVNAAIPPGMADEAAFAARRGVIAAIEKESLEKTGLRSDVVTLYQGGQYHLYRFKKYTDVRLVFAPEEQAAFFGGDPDNFEYPRFDLDICLFRVYEGGKPVRLKHYLKWSAAGAAEGELVFVSGHPGHTDRSRTVVELEYQRDVRLPRELLRVKRLEVLLGVFSERSAENARRAKPELFGLKNVRKADDGVLEGLQDPTVLERKRAAEQKLRAAVAANPALAPCAGAWDRIAQAQQVIGTNALKYNLLEHAHGFHSELFSYGRQLLRAAEERQKPNGERLEEYSDSSRESFEYDLFAEQPIYADVETLKLADGFAQLAVELGYGHPLVQKVLAGKSPRERASELIRGTKLGDAAVRKKIYEGGLPALNAAKDSMIELARLVDAEARAARKVVDVQREIQQQAHAQIAKARYAVEGDSAYPDATFTLRLAFGLVKGYEEDGRKIPHQTTLAGLYARAAEHHNEPPFDLPPKWAARRAKLNLDTPYNFVCTADIVGGNSGSPVVNRQGEFVGIIFDGNLQSLIADIQYTDEQGRAVSVHSSAIIEALTKVYDAAPLAAELLGKKP